MSCQNVGHCWKLRVELGEEPGCAGAHGQPQHPGVRSITCGRQDGPGSGDGFGPSSLETREIGSLGMMQDVRLVLACSSPGKRGEKVRISDRMLKKITMMPEEIKCGRCPKKPVLAGRRTEHVPQGVSTTRSGWSSTSIRAGHGFAVLGLPQTGGKLGMGSKPPSQLRMDQNNLQQSWIGCQHEMWDPNHCWKGPTTCWEGLCACGCRYERYLDVPFDWEITRWYSEMHWACREGKHPCTKTS